MVKLLAKVIGMSINVIGIILLAPIAILYGIFSGVSKAAASKSNESNSSEIRAMCLKMGVPADGYNQVVLNEMAKAKKLTEEIGRPGADHFGDPWNRRLALAIGALHASAEERKRSAKMIDMINGLRKEHGIGEYKSKDDIPF